MVFHSTLSRVIGKSRTRVDGGVEDGVRDRRRPDKADLAQALNAERVDNRIGFFDENHVDIVRIGVDGDVIFRSSCMSL